MHRLKLTGTFALTVSLCSLLCAHAAQSSADTIETRDGTVHSTVDIQIIRTGQIYFLTADSNLESVDVVDVTTVIFSDLETEMRAVGRMIEQGELEDAAVASMALLRDAKSPAQRLWLHGQLAQLHKALGDKIEAAGHFAAVVETDDSPVWLSLAPLDLKLNDATFYSAGEAAYFLKRAARQVDEPQIKEAVDSLLSEIEPVWETIAADDPRQYRGGSTISGIQMKNVGEPRPGRTNPADANIERPTDRAANEEADPTPDVLTTNEETFEPGEPTSPFENETSKTDSADPKSAAAIDALLAAGNFQEALNICDSLLQRPGDRDVARFLFQHGSALAGVGRSKDAAVVFSRCAIERPGTRYAPMSWIEIAIIYRDTFKQPKKATELLEFAASESESIDEPQTAKRARELLETIE